MKIFEWINVRMHVAAYNHLRHDNKVSHSWNSVRIGLPVSIAAQEVEG